MKITREHFCHIKQEIQKVLDKYGKEKLVAEYESGNFPKSAQT